MDPAVVVAGLKALAELLESIKGFVELGEGRLDKWFLTKFMDEVMRATPFIRQLRQFMDKLKLDDLHEHSPNVYFTLMDLSGRCGSVAVLWRLGLSDNSKLHPLVMYKRAKALNELLLEEGAFELIYQHLREHEDIEEADEQTPAVILTLLQGATTALNAWVRDVAELEGGQ